MFYKKISFESPELNFCLVFKDFFYLKKLHPLPIFHIFMLGDQKDYHFVSLGWDIGIFSKSGDTMQLGKMKQNFKFSHALPQGSNDFTNQKFCHNPL